MHCALTPAPTRNYGQRGDGEYQLPDRPGHRDGNRELSQPGLALQAERFGLPEKHPQVQQPVHNRQHRR